MIDYNDGLTFIVRALDKDGNEFFYNGKAGPAWITKDRAEAYRYQTREAAQHKALLFNRMTEVHGLRFIAHVD